MGAAANVSACIYLPTKPLVPLTFSFVPSIGSCMTDGGQNATLTVSTAGISTVSIGYVESKVSGCTCLSAASVWTLSYNVVGQPYSGSVSSNWNCPPEWNSMTLNNSGTTSVNTSAAKSSDVYQQWHGTGDLYIIFSPVADALLKTLPILKFFSAKEHQEAIDRIHSPLMDPHYIERLNEHFK